MTGKPTYVVPTESQALLLCEEAANRKVLCLHYIAFENTVKTLTDINITVVFKYNNATKTW